MRSVGIKTLKNKLSEYIKIAAEGETVLVCDHDRVVAEIHAPAASRAPAVSDAVLLDLLRSGILSPAIGATTPLPERQPTTTLPDLLKDLEIFRKDQ
ncbi:MAG: prevent-host-death protein [Spirochaetales bacterium]|nr:prevent-host-death protein [Spirochaetales bacterium]